MNPMADTPSDAVFAAAREIAEDFKGGVEAAREDILDYASMMYGMWRALDNTRDNLFRYALRKCKKGSKERRAIRAKLDAIDKAVVVAKRIENILCLTVEDMEQVMKPYEYDKKTLKFLNGIMDEEPTAAELKRIEEERDGDED